MHIINERVILRETQSPIEYDKFDLFTLHLQHVLITWVDWSKINLQAVRRKGKLIPYRCSKIFLLVRVTKGANLVFIAVYVGLTNLENKPADKDRCTVYCYQTDVSLVYKKPTWAFWYSFPLLILRTWHFCLTIKIISFLSFLFYGVSLVRLEVVFQLTNELSVGKIYAHIIKTP